MGTAYTYQNSKRQWNIALKVHKLQSFVILVLQFLPLSVGYKKASVGHDELNMVEKTSNGDR